MTLELDIDDLLERVTYHASLITGIREAFDYDAWPDSPPALPRQELAYHLTGYIEEGQGIRYVHARGTDLAEWEFNVPLYTVVVDSAKAMRSRGWTSPYPERYADRFRRRLHLPKDNTYGISAGSAIYMGCRVVRQIPDWPGYDGFYILRHDLMLHTKGSVQNAVGDLPNG
jgi:hypothetical protein